ALAARRRLRAPCRGDDGDVTVNQIGRERRQSVVLTFRPAILDCHVLTFGEPALPEALTECCQRIGGLAWRAAAEEANHGHRRLLRSRSERPHGSRAAERG